MNMLKLLVYIYVRWKRWTYRTELHITLICRNFFSVRYALFIYRWYYPILNSNFSSSLSLASDLLLWVLRYENQIEQGKLTSFRVKDDKIFINVFVFLVPTVERIRVTLGPSLEKFGKASGASSISFALVMFTGNWYRH